MRSPINIKYYLEDQVFIKANTLTGGSWGTGDFLVIEKRKRQQ